jgi:YHS domain-containing protein
MALSEASSTAMRRYSPVSLVTNRQWLKGREPFRVNFDGASYLLADERELQMFRAAPERYVPALGGDCVVHFSQTGERKAGLLRFGVVHENRLYFFSSDEARQAFVSEPAQYMNVDVALGGNCPVCLVELKKTVPGRPELAAVFGGSRYFFPGAQQREMFLAAPLKYAAAAHAAFGTEGQFPDVENDASAVGANDATESKGPTIEEMPPPAAEKEASEDAPIAMAGYCPVSILAESKWVRGKPDFAVLHDGRRYFMASDVHKEAFLDDVTKFIPALGGDCVVSFVDRGERVEGSVFHAVIHRGRQYLFSGVEQKDAFKQNPEAYADADLALGGDCPVRRVDSDEQVAGKAEFTEWRGGLRYQLSGPDELEKFRADPEKYAAAATPTQP